MWRWVFEDRNTGRISIASWPNPPLWVWIVARVLARVVDRGTAHDVLGAVGSVALAIWAVMELWSGVNPWRRLLGLVVLGWMVAAVVL